MGDDSILNASIRISCVELNIANRVMDIVINNKLLAGSVNEVKINGKEEVVLSDQQLADVYGCCESTSLSADECPDGKLGVFWRTLQVICHLHKIFRSHKMAIIN